MIRPRIRPLCVGWLLVFFLLAKAMADEQKPKLIRLDPKQAVWVDMKRKLVVVDGQVCLREGPLELFACPKQTKEHESVISVNASPQVVHAGLLAVGAKVGKPVQFAPEYRPASGVVVKIQLLWRDSEGHKHQAPAQQWVRHVKTGKAMQHDWVFAGSQFWTDPDSGKQYYFANDGDFICVSNFPSATLDLPIVSSQTNSQLVFEAFTEHIPPKGTKVRLVLIPQIPPKKAAAPPKTPGNR